MLVITDPHYCKSPIEKDGTLGVAIGEYITGWWIWKRRTPAYVLMRVETHAPTGERIWIPIKTFPDITMAVRAVDEYRKIT